MNVLFGHLMLIKIVSAHNQQVSRWRDCLIPQKTLFSTTSSIKHCIIDKVPRVSFEPINYRSQTTLGQYLPGDDSRFVAQIYEKSINYKLPSINIHTMQSGSTVNLPDYPFSAFDLNPANRSLFIQQLNHELSFYRLSIDQELQRNMNLLHQQSQLNHSLKVKEDQNIQALRTMSTNTQLNLVKSEHVSEQNQQSNVEGSRCNKKHRRKHEEKIDENDINETKNIPKNFGKAILSFIQKNINIYKELINPILTEGQLSITDLLIYIKGHKRKVNSINYLKEIWGYGDQKNPLCKCVRILSFIFLRKYCLSYVFNSRIKNHTTHVKYRGRIIEGLLNPEDFTCIKHC